MLKDDLVKSGAVKRGNFILTSGRQSSFYVDLKEFNTDINHLREISSKFCETVRGDVVAGVELGAVPMVIAVALEKGIPYSIIRKERWHGNKSLLIGEGVSGKRVAIIEDVVTTGGSVLKAVDILREHGAIVEDVHCVVDREEGGKMALAEKNVVLHSLLKISDIF